MTRTPLTTSLDEYEVWFLTGSQRLYGEDTLRQVAEQSRVRSPRRSTRHPMCPCASCGSRCSPTPPRSAASHSRRTPTTT